MYENQLRLQINHLIKLMLLLKFYTIVEFQKSWSLFWLVYTWVLLLYQGQIHIVKEFLLLESKNEIDFLATINQQPQLLIIRIQLICLWASKTASEFLRKLLILTVLRGRYDLRGHFLVKQCGNYWIAWALVYQLFNIAKTILILEERLAI